MAQSDEARQFARVVVHDGDVRRFQGGGRAGGSHGKTNVAVITTLNAQIALLEKRLQEKIGKQSVYQLLTSVPGIGQALATTILLETGPIDRFASVGNYASYARCVDINPAIQ
ncbi:hypothetical protein AGMMS50256_21790 [Betaproteobacteria bacterium]|nr:hypothetical protein AGMMS50256_21790 [Betaproteobacteria bacterium]